MMAIGLGKQKGAATYHEAMMTYGYPDVILSVARRVMQHAPILFGVGIVENGYGQTADMITQRLLDKIDIQALNINTITGACPEVGKIPLTLKNDRAALEIAIKSVGLIPMNRLKIMRIKNTAFLSEVDVSEAYKIELSGRGDLEISLNPRPMVFDQKGDFESFLISSP